MVETMQHWLNCLKLKSLKNDNSRCMISNNNKIKKIIKKSNLRCITFILLLHRNNEFCLKVENLFSSDKYPFDMLPYGSSLNCALPNLI